MKKKLLSDSEAKIVFRHLEQQHYDMFFTIDDSLQNYPNIDQGLKIKKFHQKSIFNLLKKYKILISNVFLICLFILEAKFHL